MRHEPVAMIYGGLDLGIHLGFAFGILGAKPRSGYVVLKRRGEGQDIAFSNFIAWLHDEWTPRSGIRRAPHVVGIEKPMPLAAFVKVHSSEDNVLVHFGLRAIALGMCRRFGIKAVPIERSTVMKHFVGRGNMKRDEGKVACLVRCHQLGLMGKDKHSLDQADACAIQDWVAATHGRRIGVLNELHLWGT
jgi:hypothetical protein